MPWHWPGTGAGSLLTWRRDVFNMFRQGTMSTWFAGSLLTPGPTCPASPQKSSRRWTTYFTELGVLHDQWRQTIGANEHLGEWAQRNCQASQLLVSRLPILPLPGT